MTTKKRYDIVAHAYDKRGRLIACATNSYTKTHPLQAELALKVGHPAQIYCHAELLCMLRCKDVPIAKLMVWRYGVDGELLCAKPCPICQEAIKMFGPGEVWYSDQGTMVLLADQ